MTTLAKVKTAASVLGATVTDEKIGESHTCSVEAPKGFIWKGHDLHEFVDSAYRPWKPDYADLLSRMAAGTIECPQGATCEWCHPEPDVED